MRSGKVLLGLVVVLIGLVSYYYFIDLKKPVQTEGSETHDKVFSVDAAKINEVKVTGSTGDTAVLRKGKNGWEMVEPSQAKADEGELSTLTSTIGSLEVTSVVDDHPRNVEQYGLEKPRITVAFRADGDNTQHRLMIGGKTPTGGDLYARKDDDRKVILVPSYVESSLDRKPFDLREKTVLKFDRDKADRVQLVHDEKTIELEKQGMDWRLTAPVAARADFSAVEGVLTRLQSAQMTALAASSADDAKRYGLDKPAVTATVGVGSSRASLLIGSDATEGSTTGVYAKDASRPMVFIVPKDLADDLKKSADDFRRKELFEFRSFNTKRLEITRDGQTFAFEKAKGAGKNGADTWRRTSPTAGNVDAAKIETLLSKISGLRAQAFADDKTKTNLSSPTIKVVATLDDGKQETATMARSGPDVYAARPDEPGAMRLATSDVDDAMQALDAVSK